MPSAPITKLTPVAVEYLCNLEELEIARDQFLSERAKLLDGLGALMLEAAGAQGQPVAASRRDDATGMYNVDIDAQYVALRAKQGKKRTAGYSVVLGSLLDHVGVQTVLWFQLKLSPAKHNRLELSALEERLGAGARSIGDGLWLYIRTSSQLGTDLDLDALSLEVQRLPELFATADPWITRRYLE